MKSFLISSNFSNHFHPKGIINSRPNATLFALASFFCFSPFVGLEIMEVSFYGAFIFALLDIFFICHLALQLFLSFKTSRKPLVYVLFLVFLSCWLAKNPLALLCKLAIMGFFCVYFHQGRRVHGYLFLQLGLVFALFIASLQFLESNLLDSSLFLPRNWQINFSQNIVIGVGSLQGGSYDHNGLFKGLIRVSGTAMEPGHFSAIMLSALLLFFDSPIMVGLSLLGILLAHSKLIIAAFFVLPIIYMGWASKIRPSLIAFLILLIYVAIIGITMLYDPTVLQHNPSIFARTEAIFALNLLDIFNVFFGVGIQNACDVLSKTPGATRIWTSAQLSQDPCAIGVNSFLGSLLLDLGFFGTVYFLWFISNISHVFARTPTKKPLQRQYITSLGIIVATFALHFLTAFPSGLVLLSEVMASLRKKT